MNTNDKRECLGCSGKPFGYHQKECPVVAYDGPHNQFDGNGKERHRE